MSLRNLRTAASLLALLAPACVVRLNERNEPLPNGGVTGANADCSAVQPEPPGSPSGAAETRFVGRYDSIDRKDPNAKKLRFDWSGNMMSARFEGTDVTWGVSSGLPADDPKAKELRDQVYEVIIDGVPQQVILPDYTNLANPIFTRTHKLPAGVHEITVVRSSEADGGPGAWVPFTFPGGTQLPPTRFARKIEYIGDSITCGYGNEGANATCPFATTVRKEEGPNGEVEVKLPETQNIYLAYGSIAARELSAEATTLCFSGKGVVKNYRERNQGRDAATTIPQYYMRTLAKEDPVANPQFPEDRIGVPWTFDEPDKPDVVFINLGQNDFGRDIDQNNVADGIDLAGFRAGYKEFVVGTVRAKRPDAHIFLAVPPMVTDVFPLDNARTDFRTTLRSLVEELNAAGDAKIYFIELVEMGVRYGLGCDYHPNLEVHRIMAEQVVGAIRAKTCWSPVTQ